jgi:signal transduction histidine kinase/ActR/RegA family two-component response regulator
LWNTILAGHVWHGEIINRHKDGGQLLEEMTITPVLDQENRTTHFIAIRQDITARKRLEEQLRQSQKMEAIGQLSGGVAHDFNNILTAILGNATLLSDPDVQPAEVHESAAEIIRATHRAADLTRQLLLFSRRQTMRPATADLNHIVSQSLKMLHRILGEDITIISEYAPGLPTVFADSGMMEQVILNLAVNSRDAMPNGGRLNIRTSTETIKNPEAAADTEARPHVCLTVADNGSGIPPEVLPHIFEPFFTTKDVGKGTGLGLATVYGIVRQHNGWITVNSQPSTGTTFQVYLPAIAGAQASQPALPPVSQLPRGSGTILVVEDEPPVRKFVCQLLQRLGYTVLQTENGAEALATWQQHREKISLVVTDIVMPGGISGYELADQLLAQAPRLKIIFTSGYTGKPAASGTALVEGDNFIHKPFDPEALAEIVRRKIAGPPAAS